LRREGIYSSTLATGSASTRPWPWPLFRSRCQKTAEPNPLRANSPFVAAGRMPRCPRRLGPRRRPHRLAQTVSELPGYPLPPSDGEPTGPSWLVRAGQPHDCLACAALGPRAHVSAPDAPFLPHLRRSSHPPRARPARALTNPTNAGGSGRMQRVFVDQPGRKSTPTLLAQGIYHCSIRTIVSQSSGSTPSARTPLSSLATPSPRSPSCCGKAPSGPGPGLQAGWGRRWTSFYLYVILDSFSRPWRLVCGHAESAALFKPLLDDAIASTECPTGQLTLPHRGAPE